MARKGNESKAKDVSRIGLSEQGEKTLAMLTALEDEDNLSQWEITFIESLSDWFLNKERELTPRQYEVLERVYRKFN
jgi:DNA-dependent RNA polymerase auxiliary subunit epsilon